MVAVVGFRWLRRGLERKSEQDGGSLEAVYQRRFVGTDRRAFEYFWREIAAIVGRSPAELLETDRLSELCSRRRWWEGVDGRADNLLHFLYDNGGDGPPPERPLDTLGELMDHLLSCFSKREGPR